MGMTRADLQREAREQRAVALAERQLVLLAGLVRAVEYVASAPRNSWALHDVAKGVAEAMQEEENRLNGNP